jgi:hypothetical protein
MVLFYDWTVILPVIAGAASILLLLFYFFVKAIDRAAVKRIKEVPPTPGPARFKEDGTGQAEDQ